MAVFLTSIIANGRRTTAKFGGLHKSKLTKRDKLFMAIMATFGVLFILAIIIFATVFKG